MPAIRLEWRQFRGEGAKPVFLHRLAHVDGARRAVELACGLGDAAWAREFRVVRGRREAFTDLHRIQDWARGGGALPAQSPHHVWRADLLRDLAADRLVDAVGSATDAAVGAGVLARADADTLARFARSAVLRPRL